MTSTKVLTGRTTTTFIAIGDPFLGPKTLIRRQPMRDIIKSCLHIRKTHEKTRKLCNRKDDRAMSPIHKCPENFRDSLTAHGYYSQHVSWAFVPIDPMNVPTKFEVRSFTRSWDNRGYPKNLGSPWSPGYAHAPFSPKFLMGFYSDWPCKCTHQIWIRSFTWSWDKRG